MVDEYQQSCANCGVWKDLKFCSRCRVVRYCSKPCQRSDWPHHKGEEGSVCRALLRSEYKGLGPDVLKLIARFSLQIGSDILSVQHIQILLRWSKAKSFQLLYRGSRDSFTPSAFHKLCDGKTPTIVAVLATNGAVFGGFTPLSWKGSGDKHDRCTWLFSFHKNRARRFRKVETTNSVYAHPDSLPCFGMQWGQGDLVLHSYCDKRKDNFSEPAMFNIKRGTLCGASLFQVKELEVFIPINSTS